MGIGALGLATLTVLVGTLALADVGPAIAARKLLGGHVVAALAGVVVLGVGVFAANVGLTAVSLVVLLIAVGLGTRMLLGTRTDAKLPGIVVVHGAAAAATILFVVLAILTGR